MRLRSLGFVALAAAAVMQSCQPACAPTPPAAPADVAAPTPDISAVIINGQGSGHGRGLSAWGAYGWAINGYSWDQILGYYYGGTQMGLSGNPRIGVRLLAQDGARNTGVMSTQGRAIFNGVAYGAIWTEYQGNGVYNVAGSAVPGCPGDPLPWVPLGSVQATPNRPAVTFTTDVDETGAWSGDVLGLCQPDRSIIHYRGAISALIDSTGATRTVNDVSVENYLLGVVSREVSTSWGNAAGGLGMNALYAMAVAARSFALAQGRYPYAKTCDTDACQVYGGAAYRASPGSPTSWPRAQVCETGNPTFECANTTRAVRETGGYIRVWPNGSVVSTEYSASHGPGGSAGGPFPVVDDSMSNVPGNPNYTWNRTIDAATLEATYGLGNLVNAYTEHDPSSPYAGAWGNRVVLQGTAGTVVVPNLDVRRTFGFPSHGFVIGGLVR
jgi:hypothetical protein